MSPPSHAPRLWVSFVKSEKTNPLMMSSWCHTGYLHETGVTLLFPCLQVKCCDLFDLKNALSSSLSDGWKKHCEKPTKLGGKLGRKKQEICYIFWVVWVWSSFFWALDPDFGLKARISEANLLTFHHHLHSKSLHTSAILKKTLECPFKFKVKNTQNRRRHISPGKINRG